MIDRAPMDRDVAGSFAPEYSAAAVASDESAYRAQRVRCDDDIY